MCLPAKPSPLCQEVALQELILAAQIFSVDNDDDDDYFPEDAHLDREFVLDVH